MNRSFSLKFSSSCYIVEVGERLQLVSDVEDRGPVGGRILVIINLSSRDIAMKGDKFQFDLNVPPLRFRSSSHLSGQYHNPLSR